MRVPAAQKDVLIDEKPILGVPKSSITMWDTIYLVMISMASLLLLVLLYRTIKNMENLKRFIAKEQEMNNAMKSFKENEKS